jgi:phosphoglycerate dehydrogenase-like enzyme
MNSSQKKETLRIVSFSTHNPLRQAEIRSGVQLLATARPVEVSFPLDEQGALSCLATAEILLTWKFTPAMCAAAPNLRWIHLSGAGANHVLFDQFLTRDIILTNTRGIHGPFMAEWTLAALLHISQQLSAVEEWRRDRDWKTHKDYIQRHRFLLRGKRALIFGAGEVGKEIARLLQAIGLHGDGITLASHKKISELIGDFDIVIICAPLTTETRGLFDATLLSKMKPGSILVNVARGQIVNEPALIDVLKSGPLAYAALDVFAVEPLAPESELFTLPNVFMAPHVSGNYPDYTKDVIGVFLGNLAHYIRNEPLNFIVNKQRGY